VLALAWAIAQLGWVAGPAVMFLFSFVTYYTSTLLSACYRSGDSVSGKRNYTYMDAVQSNLGNFCHILTVPIKLKRRLLFLKSFLYLNYLFILLLGGGKVKICGLVQYLNLFGVAIGYTIASAISMM
jgi:hypothetical protein